VFSCTNLSDLIYPKYLITIEHSSFSTQCPNYVSMARTTASWRYDDHIVAMPSCPLSQKFFSKGQIVTVAKTSSLKIIGKEFPDLL